MTYLSAWWLLTSALFSTTANAWPRRHSTPPVCIIGAGPSGLTAASRLEAQGVKAIVFDKQAELGGKCQSYYDEQGIFHPLGAAFYSNGSYTQTLKVLDIAGVPSEDFALTGTGTRQPFGFNYSTGVTAPVRELNLTFVAQLASEIPRYIQTWNTEFAKYSVSGFKNGLPEDLSVSGTQWFRSRNFTALPILLVNPTALYGYGDINKVPAAYILQYFTPDILTGFTGLHNVYYTDFQKVFKEWAKRELCKTPVKLSHEIRCIDRSGKSPVIKYTKPDGDFYKWGKQECSSLIMAFPPTIYNLERTGLDLTREENDVFKEVVIHNYFASAVEFKLPFGVSYIADSDNVTVPPPANNEPIAVLRLNEQSNVSTAWSWGPDNIFVAEEPVRQQLLTTMSKINKDPRNETVEAEALCPADIRAFRKWDYFPHFNGEALRDDIYSKLNKLQGCHKTFWASGLQGMETVEWAIRAGQDVVDTFVLKDGYLAR